MDRAHDLRRQAEHNFEVGSTWGGVCEQGFAADVLIAGRIDKSGDVVIVTGRRTYLSSNGRLEAELEELRMGVEPADCGPDGVIELSGWNGSPASG